MHASPRALACACAASLLFTACPGSSGQDPTPDDRSGAPPTTAELRGVAGRVRLVGSTAVVELGHPVPDAPLTSDLQAVDLSDPAHPALGRAVPVPGMVGGMGAWNGRLLVTHVRCDPVLDTCADPRLDAYDPVTLQTTATMSLGSSLPIGLTVAGDRAFFGGLGAPFSAMTVVDLSSSQVVSRYGTHLANLVAVRGDRAYLSGPSLTLEVVDLTTLSAPRRIGALPAPSSAGWPLSLAVVETAAGLRAWVGYVQGIAEVDLSDEAHPVLLRTMRIDVLARGLALDRSRALVPDASATLVLDASAPAFPAPSARLTGPVDALDAAWLGTRAVTVGVLHGRSDASALSVFDVAGP